MSLYEQIHNHLKEAMKERDVLRRDTLRSLESALKNEAIEKRRDLSEFSDDEVVTVVRRLVKQRQDSIASYRAGAREDLAEKEQAEMDLLSSYLPAAMPEAELRVLLGEALAETGASTKSDFGKLMGVMMKKVSGRADGTVVKKMVEEALL